MKVVKGFNSLIGARMKVAKGFNSLIVARMKVVKGFNGSKCKLRIPCV